nr:lipocalin family protein [Bacteriovorax sp. HI3]
MRALLLISGLLFSFSLFAVDVPLKPSPLPTAKDVDVARYIGKWYVISSLPQFFTRNCEGQTAEYGIVNEKIISVHNVCYKENGKTKDIRGKGVIQDAPNNARLIVTFDNFWTRLFRVKGEYVIIKLGEGYDTVMVGSTNRKSLWIMSRQPTMDPTTLMEYKNLAHDLSFPVTQLQNSKY